MRRSDTLSVVLLHLVALALGVIAKTSFLSPHPFILSILVVTIVIVAFEWVRKYIEVTTLRYMASKILVTGAGIRRSVIETQATLVQLTVLVLIVVISFTMAVAPRYGVSPLLAITSVGLVLAVVVILLSTHLRSVFLTSFRKTNTEVELPFLMAMMRTLGETHLSLYDLLEIIKRSTALPAWAKEIRLAERLSNLTGLPLLYTMNMMTEVHPSPLVRDIFRRIVSVGLRTGSVRDVIERAFSFVYERIEARLERLTEKLDIINGVFMFLFMFFPITLASMSPLMGQGPIEVGFLTLITEIPNIILIYAFFTHIYPSGFAIRIPKLLIATLAGFMLTIFYAVFYVSPVVTMYFTAPITARSKVIEPAIPEPVLYALMGVTLLIPTILSERYYSMVKAYTRFVRVATDAAEVSSSMGEDFASALEHVARDYGKRVYRLAKSVVESYRSEILRRAVVARAPNTLFASLIETIEYTLLVGAPHKALKAMMKSYEGLINLWERIGRVSKTLDGMIFALTGLLAFFIKYLEKAYTSFLLTIQNTQKLSGGGMMFSFQLFNIDLNVYTMTSVVTLLSAMTVSLFVGKTRGGSLVFGARSALITLLIYASVRLFTTYVVPSPVQPMSVTPQH